VDVKVGDFNGDGKADLAGMEQGSDQWWVGLSTGSALQTTPWGAWSPAAGWDAVAAGNFA
jgi:hypothetical protein